MSTNVADAATVTLRRVPSTYLDAPLAINVMRVYGCPPATAARIIETLNAGAAYTRELQFTWMSKRWRECIADLATAGIEMTVDSWRVRGVTYTHAQWLEKQHGVASAQWLEKQHGVTSAQRLEKQHGVTSAHANAHSQEKNK